MLIRTLRIKVIGENLPERAVIAFWHSKMLAGWWISRESSVALVSKSKDGGYLNSVLNYWGYRVVRGSSSSSGKEALDEAIEAVRNKYANHIVVTPDGPRGPKEIFKRGIFIASCETTLPLYFLTIEYHTALRLKKSWDQFEIPYPFTKVTVVVSQIETSNVPESGDQQKAFLEMMSQPFQANHNE